MPLTALKEEKTMKWQLTQSLAGQQELEKAAEKQRAEQKVEANLLE